MAQFGTIERELADPYCDYCRGKTMTVSPIIPRSGRLLPISRQPTAFSTGLTPTATIPPTSGGGAAAQLNLGDVGTQIGGGVVGIALDWLRSRIVPSGPPPSGPTPLTGPVPSSNCPEGTFGVPPFCVDLQPGGATQGGGMVVTPGEAVMGRYGAALSPMADATIVRRCLRGMVLGNDGLCYNKRDLNKRDRMWVPGRKPLLTGGDLNAISRANRAANKLKAQQKRLQAMGMLPKPSRGRRVSPHVLVGTRPPGTSIVNVD